MALILEFASVLWCLVRTIKIYIINFVYCVIVTGAMLTFETEISVIW